MRRGYFRVPLGAAHQLVAESDGPELLAGYITLCSYAYPRTREFTAAGAKSIKKATGVTQWRSLRIMDELRALRFGTNGDKFFIEPTGAKKKNADEYRLHDWGEPHAYVPQLMVDAGLSRFLDAGEGDVLLRRDALLALLCLYANTDYADYMGAPIDRFPYQVWDTAGERRDGEFELGMVESVGRHQVWLVGPPDSPEGSTWTCPSSVTMQMFGAEGPEYTARMWSGLWFLLNTGLVCKVAIVEHDHGRYPLWYFNGRLRESLAQQFGISTDLARHFQNLASRGQLDADNQVVRDAVDTSGGDGTGLFFCVRAGQKVPFRVYTVLAPMWHAPTPQNLDGLEEVARVTNAVLGDIHRLDARLKGVA